MQLLSGDANLGAQPEHAAVGEAGRRVDVHGSSVHARGERLGRAVRLGHDSLRVARAVAVDVLNRAADAVHHADRDFQIQELGVEVVFGGQRRVNANLGKQCLCLRIGDNLDPVLNQ